MPKQLITAIGLIVSLGVIALGVFLVALPLYFQAVGVEQQASNVSATNDIYQAQVDSLRAEAERQDEIDASVASLRAQIPGVPQLDSVFEVVGRAAESTGVTIQEISAGAEAPFTPRAGLEGVGSAPAPQTTDPQEEEGADSESGEDAGQSPANPAPTTSEGRQQIEFTIRVTAGSMTQATEFLDELRSGPRLLNSMTAITGREPSGDVTLRVTALTYVETEG